MVENIKLIPSDCIVPSWKYLSFSFGLTLNSVRIDHHRLPPRLLGSCGCPDHQRTASLVSNGLSTPGRPTMSIQGVS